MMRPSEAIRLGATMSPQAFGKAHDGDARCALAAASDALGVAYYDFWNKPPEEWGFIFTLTCPECKQTPINPAHLNDDHRWSRERIADFVELHEPLSVAVAPEELVTCK